MQRPSPFAVLTASFGDGHNAAAFGVAAALRELSHQSVEPLDLFRQTHPDTMHLLSRGYRYLITHCPAAWRVLYGIADRIALGDGAPDGLPSLTRAMACYLNTTKPQAIVSTYPLYGHLIERLFGAGPLPFGLVTMVTDSTSINRSWVNGASGHYAVADAPSARYFKHTGVPEERLHITGFPISPDFGRGRRERAETAPPSPFQILYFPSTGAKRVEATLDALGRFIASAQLKIRLVVVLGRHDKRLRPRVERVAPPDSEILGWTEKMATLLGSSHLYIGKAGGASVQEALAAACPMLVDYMVPGQEEGNAQLLIDLGAGDVAPAPAELDSYLRALTADGGGWSAMRSAAIEKGGTGAASRVAELAIELAETRTTPNP